MKLKHSYLYFDGVPFYATCDACHHSLLNVQFHKVEDLDLPPVRYPHFFICEECAPTKKESINIAKTLYSIMKL